MRVLQHRENTKQVYRFPMLYESRRHPSAGAVRWNLRQRCGGCSGASFGWICGAGIRFLVPTRQLPPGNFRFRRDRRDRRSHEASALRLGPARLAHGLRRRWRVEGTRRGDALHEVKLLLADRFLDVALGAHQAPGAPAACFESFTQLLLGSSHTSVSALPAFRAVGGRRWRSRE